jgi:methionyl aminopeptidase
LDEQRARITKDGIRIYEDADFAGMRQAGRIAAEILDAVTPLVVPGATTAVLDDFITAEIKRHGVTSATIGYKGYKHASCISVNHVVCHGIPGSKVLMDGDILNIDVTVIVDGWFGDTSRMYVAGALARKAERLIEVTHEGLMRGIAAVKPGNTFGDIGHAIQAYVGTADVRRSRFLRPRAGPGVPRAAERAALWSRRIGSGAGGRHVLHHRADGEPWPPGNQGAGR